MKKVGLVLTVAALATLVGCKDADYKGRRSSGPQNEVKTVAPAQEVKPVPVKKCQCAPGTKHTAPCACGAADCTCVVVKKCSCPPGTKHVAPCTCGAPDCACVVEKKPVAPEVTVYVVQSGDYLAKISKKFNVTIAAIRKLNPSIKGDSIRVGQKLKLPGKIDVGAPAAPVAKARPAKSVKKQSADFTGPVKEYVVRSGDTLGSIAYGNGMSIRQLRKLNNLSSDVVRVGQKLKVSAAGKPAKASAPAKKVEAPAQQKKEVAPAAAPVQEAPVAAPETTPAAPSASVPETPAAEEAPLASAEKPVEAAPATSIPTTDYVVQEGDDVLTLAIHSGVSSAVIRELNNLGENDQLKPGQTIKIPAEAQ